jgi:outer membrane lipoprotein LolB
MTLHKHLFFVLFLTFLCGLLSACATMEPATQVALNQQQSWEQRENQLSHLKQWKIKGALGINDSKQAWRSSVYWQQFARNVFDLKLFGPVGVGTLQVTGTAHHAQLTTAQNETFSAENADLLLAQQTGWLLPITHLYYWIRGIPVPGIPADREFDNYNHLLRLSQQGWTIQFQRYTAINGLDLPSKILLQYKQLKIRIIISQWKLT